MGLGEFSSTQHTPEKVSELSAQKPRQLSVEVDDIPLEDLAMQFTIFGLTDLGYDLVVIAVL